MDAVLGHTSIHGCRLKCELESSFLVMPVFLNRKARHTARTSLRLSRTEALDESRVSISATVAVLVPLLASKGLWLLYVSVFSYVTP
jgi:hypothetical protein